MADSGDAPHGTQFFHFCIRFLLKKKTPASDIGAPRPQWDLIILFSHTFSPKNARVGHRRPPTGIPGSATADFSYWLYFFGHQKFTGQRNKTLAHACLPIVLPQSPGRLQINRLIQSYQLVDRNWSKEMHPFSFNFIAPWFYHISTCNTIV